MVDNQQQLQKRNSHWTYIYAVQVTLTVSMLLFSPFPSNSIVLQTLLVVSLHLLETRAWLSSLQHAQWPSTKSCGRRRLEIVQLHATKNGNEVDPFDLFCTMRTGFSPSDDKTRNPRISSLCSDTVYWVGTGSVFQAYSGDILAHWEGIDVGKAILRPIDDSNKNEADSVAVRQLSRKLFWFRDSETGELLHTYQGEPVLPIRYECQVFDYQRHPADPSTILASVVYSNRKNVPVLPLTHQQPIPDLHLYQAPIFLDLPPTAPNQPRYQAWEFYDYTIPFPSTTNDEGAISLSAAWCRQGSVSPFSPTSTNSDDNAESSSTSPTVMKGIAHRVNSFAELPHHIQDYILENDPLFQKPPQDMQEVQQIELKQQ